MDSIHDCFLAGVRNYCTHKRFDDDEFPCVEKIDSLFSPGKGLAFSSSFSSPRSGRRFVAKGDPHEL